MKSMKKYLYLNKLGTFSLYSCMCIFVIGALSRDIRLQQLFIRTQESQEFKLSNIFCGELTRCTRIGGETFGLLLQNTFLFFGKIFYTNPTWQEFYINEDEYYSLFNNLSSIIFRILCIAPVIFYFNKALKNDIGAKTMIIIGLTSLFSGFPLYYLNNLFGIYLVNYDYMVIFVLGVFLNFYEYILKSSILLFVYVSFATITFENLGVVVTISIFLLSKKRNLKITKTLISGIAFLISLLFLFLGVIVNSGSIGNNNSDGRFRALNLDLVPEIIGAIVIMCLWSYILGIIVSYLAFRSYTIEKLFTLNSFFSSTLLQGISIGYCISFAVGFFISILSEFGRQFLFLQLVIFLIGIKYGIGQKIRLKS